MYLVGGPGSIAVLSAWKLDTTGGGSSDAVAALIGAFTLSLAIDRHPGRWDWPAQLYGVFFATYLTTFDLAGLTPSIIIGNTCIVAMVVARRAVPAAVLSRVCLVVVLVGGVLVTAAHDGHGTGILGGAAVASLVLVRRWVLSRAGRGQPIVQFGLAVVGVWAFTVLAWVAWTPLLGVDMVVESKGSGRFEVGWVSVSVVAVSACLLGWVTLRLLQRCWPPAGPRAWLGLCSIVAVVSLVGPMVLAVGATTRAAVICLHLICGAGVVLLLAPPQTAGTSAWPPAVKLTVRLSTGRARQAMRAEALSQWEASHLPDKGPTSVMRQKSAG